MKAPSLVLAKKKKELGAFLIRRTSLIILTPLSLENLPHIESNDLISNISSPKINKLSTENQNLIPCFLEKHLQFIQEKSVERKCLYINSEQGRGFPPQYISKSTSEQIPFFKVI